MTTNQQDFEQLVKDAGVPTTTDEFRAKWEIEVAAQGSAFTNNSDYSPFWRLVTALVTAPAVWLVQMLVTNLLPQSFLKTATSTFLELLAWGYNVERKQPVKTLGNVRFTRASTIGTLEVPAGTIIQTAPINGNVYQVITTATVTFANGSSTVTAPVEAAATGAAYNLATGYYAILPTPISGVVSVTNLADWITTPGADAETDDDMRARVRNQFSAINQWHTDAVYRSIIASFPGVSVNNVYFQHNAPRGPGTANAYVMFEIGNPDSTFIASIQAEITDNGNHGHGDDLVVYAMPETQHTLTVQYWIVPNMSTAERTQLNTDITQFIRAAFRENTNYAPTKTFPFARFSLSRLAQELHSQFPKLASVDFTQDDIVSGLAIPRLQTLTVTEQT